jgi:hypothetical protein
MITPPAVRQVCVSMSSGGPHTDNRAAMARCQSKVQNLDPLPSRNHDVFGFQVAVDDAAGVRGHQGLGYMRDQGSKNLAHATSADGREDFVGAELCAGRAASV